jgi:uncharacterized oligopeptide transporter (OPT) family protein
MGEFTVGTKPPGAKEFTTRAVVVGMLVAVVMGASYPYVVLKLGFGPNVSVVAAFLGFLGLAFAALFTGRANRWENNIVMTAGTSAAQTAFMCVLLAAFDLLSPATRAKFGIEITLWKSFAWLTAAGFLGVLMAVPMRQHFVVDEKLTYADGVAAAETVVLLDSKGKGARGALWALIVGTIASAFVMFFQQRYFKSFVIPDPILTSATWLFGTYAATMGMGLSTSLLSVGSGMLIGIRVTVSMLVGTFISWTIAPHYLIDVYHIIDRPTRNEILRWVMWPATGMLVAAGLTALALRWRILYRTFKNLTGDSIRTDEFPLRWVAIGAALASVALVIVQKWALDLPIWMTLVAILLSVPLMLVGLRVLGETNWGPISALSNMMQGLFAFIAPGHVGANMIASGTCGTIAADSQAIMQDFKAGHIVGSSPKHMTYAQLIAVPIGAFAVSYMYPVLRAAYGIGGEHGLTSPISAKWAGFAEFLAAGFKALPPGATAALIIATILGVVLTVLEQRWKWVLSPTSMGIAMLVPGATIVAMFIGGLVDLIWRRGNPEQADVYSIPLASGLIAGEAILAVVLAICSAFGVVPGQ